MTKEDYLEKECVQNFVGWLSQHLDTQTFAHSYRQRATGTEWSCDSLHDAFKQYAWGSQSFDQNNARLAELRQALCHALGPRATDVAACNAAIDVMDWGGVRPGNVRWLDANRHGLVQLLIHTRDALNAGDTQGSVLSSAKLRFNAGMSKVYSLICQNFVIYDSRVAAALGWAVTRFCQAHSITQLPAELAFPWAPARQSATHPSANRRNPSTNTLQFPQIRRSSDHAQWNLKASWLLEAVLEHPNAENSLFMASKQLGHGLRALEAALFMIGYDLTRPASAAEPEPRVVEVQQKEVSSSDGGWVECFTIAQSKQFFYRITESGIQVKDGTYFSFADIKATLDFLCKNLGDKQFPLSNSATDVPNGCAPMGLGWAYAKSVNGNPPDTSRLAAILEECGVIVPVDIRVRKGRLWTVNPKFFASAEGSASLDIVRIWRGLA
ncbi:hypothetical protein [Malikia spinosa]|uniref:hypothetical protein n=1 Tax=Malikia spinosa TaxID=86180 RepID=UPI001B807AF5|nr:hypothetical protein [Malikia spinosa]